MKQTTSFRGERGGCGRSSPVHGHRLGQGQPGQFPGTPPGGPGTPEWLGRQVVRRQFLGIYRFVDHRLQELLQQFGFEYEAVIRSWYDRGWLLFGIGRRKKQVRLEGLPLYMTTISRSAIEQMDGAS